MNDASPNLDTMTAGTYVKNRLQHQIDWYDDHSERARRVFLGLRSVEIIAAATIPFLVGLEENASLIAAGVLGVMIAALAGLLALSQFQERWVAWRMTCENLKREKFRFLTRTAPYHSDKPFDLLVDRVEALMSQENTEWSSSRQARPEPGAPGNRGEPPGG